MIRVHLLHHQHLLPSIHTSCELVLSCKQEVAFSCVAIYTCNAPALAQWSSCHTGHKSKQQTSSSNCSHSDYQGWPRGHKSWFGYQVGHFVWIVMLSSLDKHWHMIFADMVWLLNGILLRWIHLALVWLNVGGCVRCFVICCLYGSTVGSQCCKLNFLIRKRQKFESDYWFTITRHSALGSVAFHLHLITALVLPSITNSL